MEWKGQHPGWVSFPATFVPHPRPMPKWKIINGQRWPLDKRGRPWPRTRYGRPTCPFDELPPGFPAPGTQYELMRKLENPTLFFGDEPMPTVEEFSLLAARLRAERAAATPLPQVQPKRAYDGDELGPVRDYMDAMRVVEQQLREFAAAARQREAARQARVEEQDASAPERIDYDLLVTPDMADTPPPAEPSGDGAAHALVAGGTAAAGPAIPGALGQGALGRAAAGLLGAAAARATLLGGVLWPSPTGDSTLSGTGLTLADALGFTPPTLPDGADPGFDANPDAGEPTMLVTPAAPQAGPSIEVFERSELRRNMEAKGKITKGQVAHHIVPGGRPMNGGRDASPTQRKLDELKIDRNGVDNGVALSPGFHARIHTKGYYDTTAGADGR